MQQAKNKFRGFKQEPKIISDVNTVDRLSNFEYDNFSFEKQYQISFCLCIYIFMKKKEDDIMTEYISSFK